jgi:predicted molibdopterin-dependent oxidoreductase YjgC
MIEQIKERKIRGMYIIGENPVLSFPASNLVAEALASLDFLVVQDMFPTETTRLANVILPATSFAEKEGTFTNFEGAVSRIRKAIAPLSESLSDWEIILRLADKMEHPLPFSSLQQVMDEIEELIPSYEGYADTKTLSRAEPKAWGASHIFGGQFLSGFACFSPVEYIPQEERTKEDYPFTLLTGTLLYHFGTGVRSSRASRLKKFLLQEFVEINESDAKKLKIINGDEVKLISSMAELTTTARITDTLPEGTVFMPLSFPKNSVNRLFSITLDPKSKTPSLKACHVRIERTRIHG